MCIDDLMAPYGIKNYEITLQDLYNKCAFKETFSDHVIIIDNNIHKWISKFTRK